MSEKKKSTASTTCVVINSTKDTKNADSCSPPESLPHGGSDKAENMETSLDLRGRPQRPMSLAMARILASGPSRPPYRVYTGQLFKPVSLINDVQAPVADSTPSRRELPDPTEPHTTF
uniref:Uncharacterized protein n=1 Tax=Plectus sambesii TaxID=2011161 RepID=A0A914UR86_9BILA